MKNVIKWSSTALAVAAANGLIVSQATAAVENNEGFIESSSATLSNRTMNFNRDFRSPGVAQSKRDETATGFVLNFESGYSRGPIGLGFDTIAMMGIKLDSTNADAGTGLLPSTFGDSGPANYAEIRGAVKAHIVEDTILRYGVHLPSNPVIAYDDARLLPNHYEGYSITNESIDGLFVEAGRMNDRSEMNSSSETDGAFIADEKITYLGGTYAFSDDLSTSLYTSDADNLWKRHFVGLTYNLPLANDMSLVTDLAHYQTSDESGPATDYDNDATSLALTLGAGNHAFVVAYQQMGGDAGFTYYDGAIFLANSVQYLDFNAKDERSYQARYDYDFAGLGLPGLTFMTRYITSDNIDAAPAVRDSRWERDTNISYTVQNGALEGVNVLWRNATIRQDDTLDGGDVDENRLIVSYTWDLL
ncbi:OprD family outer membrane porin [uncultured Halopseudomonas sp.]|uniref:OprD family outer membrane porin n=1 Tax=uncultured Halopseudomonas sp. TaxID=2901193 RepID=UPI0030EF1328|tara:strand:+ start:35427 stop:36680 length:1254 start_codon:yes stop_codon:yes gene_type:complete